MKKSIILCFLILIFVSCQKDNNDVFYDILDDNFLLLTDTIAYKHNSFFITPNESVTTSTSILSKSYKICIEKEIIDSKDYIHGVAQELANTNYNPYLQLLNKSPDSKFKIIDIKKIKSIGKFELIALSKPKIDKKFEKKYIGIIRFYTPYINEKNAILIYSKQSSQKDGVVNACLFKKQGVNWELEKKIELERW